MLESGTTLDWLLNRLVGGYRPQNPATQIEQTVADALARIDRYEDYCARVDDVTIDVTLELQQAHTAPDRDEVDDALRELEDELA